MWTKTKSLFLIKDTDCRYDCHDYSDYLFYPVYC